MMPGVIRVRQWGQGQGKKKKWTYSPLVVREEREKKKKSGTINTGVGGEVGDSPEWA